MTHTLQSPHQRSEMDGSMHPTHTHLKVSVQPTLRAAVGQSTALSHPRPDGLLILVIRHSCFSVPSCPSFLFETQVNEKGEKSIEHIFFLSLYLNVLIFYFTTVTYLFCVPLTSKPPSVHELHLLLYA